MRMVVRSANATAAASSGAPRKSISAPIGWRC